MMLKYAIALAIVLIVAAVFTWAFLPARYLPGNRARHLRIRLQLRLHPGKGWPMSSCATPARSSRRAPNPTSTP
jgi:hypothetical protein